MIEAHRKKDWDIEAIFLGGLRFKQCSVLSISADLPGSGSGVNKCQIGVPHRTRCSNTQKWWIAAYSAACNETKQHLAVGEAPLFAVSKKEGRYGWAYRWRFPEARYELQIWISSLLSGWTKRCCPTLQSTVADLCLFLVVFLSFLWDGAQVNGRRKKIFFLLLEQLQA